MHGFLGSTHAGPVQEIGTRLEPVGCLKRGSDTLAVPFCWVSMSWWLSPSKPKRKSPRFCHTHSCAVPWVQATGQAHGFHLLEGLTELLVLSVGAIGAGERCDGSGMTNGMNPGVAVPLKETTRWMFLL